jgi:hypothetical protein
MFMVNDLRCKLDWPQGGAKGAKKLRHPSSVDISRGIDRFKDLRLKNRPRERQMSKVEMTPNDPPQFRELSFQLAFPVSQRLQKRIRDEGRRKRPITRQLLQQPSRVFFLGTPQHFDLRRSRLALQNGQRFLANGRKEAVDFLNHFFCLRHRISPSPIQLGMRTGRIEQAVKIGKGKVIRVKDQIESSAPTAN